MPGYRCPVEAMCSSRCARPRYTAALQASRTIANVRPGQTVLVTGTSGRRGLLPLTDRHGPYVGPNPPPTPADGPLLPKEEPMTVRTKTPNLLDNPPVPVQVKLAAAWTSFMFLYIYVDYFHLYKPGTVDNIRAGVVFEFDISSTLLTVMLASVAIPAVMVMLSMTLPARVNRATNLVVASLYIPYSVFNAVGESWDWALFYGLSIGIEVLLLVFVLRSAWTWSRTPAGPQTTDLRQ